METVTQTPASPQSSLPKQIAERTNSFVWGVLLICAGIFFLLQQFSFFGSLSGLLISVLFAAGACVFGFVYLQRPRQNWWALIPGCTLAGLSMVTMIDQLGISALEQVSGPLFLASIGMGFALIFLTNPENWWALIPGGVMMTIAATAYASELDLGIDEGAIFMMGLGLTFATVGFMPGRHGKTQRWAFIPAAVLTVIGLLIGFSMDVQAQYIWPLALIGGGILLVGKTLMDKKASS